MPHVITEQQSVPGTPVGSRDGHRSNYHHPSRPYPYLYPYPGPRYGRLGSRDWGRGCCFGAHLEAGVRSATRAAAIGRRILCGWEPRNTACALAAAASRTSAGERLAGSGMREPRRKGCSYACKSFVCMRESAAFSFCTSWCCAACLDPRYEMLKRRAAHVASCFLLPLLIVSKRF